MISFFIRSLLHENWSQIIKFSSVGLDIFNWYWEYLTSVIIQWLYQVRHGLYLENAAFTQIPKNTITQNFVASEKEATSMTTNNKVTKIYLHRRLRNFIVMPQGPDTFVTFLLNKSHKLWKIYNPIVLISLTWDLLQGLIYNRIIQEFYRIKPLYGETCYVFRMWNFLTN